MTKRLPMITLLVIISSSLFPNGLVLIDNEQDITATSDVAKSHTETSTYITGGWNVSYSILRALVGGDTHMNYGNFCEAIEQYFLPFNQRLVGLFVGWSRHANTSTTDIPYHKWVDDWLSACDRYSIGNLVYFGEWGTSSPAPSWWSDVLEAYPDMQSCDKNGLPVVLGEANPLSIDHSQLVRQFEEDLKQLWEYYGEHSSWIGWGSFPGDFAHYAPTDTRTSQTGFADFSISNFAKTIYYLQDVNETGFHSDGTKCRIWEEFKEYTPLKFFGWKTWQDSDGLDVHNGTGAGGQLVAMKFEVSENMTGFAVRWYGRRIGHPLSPLNLELYEDVGDAPENLGIPIESVTQTWEEIGTNADWQPFVSFSSELVTGKYYWIVFQTNDGNETNKYEVYRRNFKTDGSTCKVSGDGYFPKMWEWRGSAILWIKNVDGADKKIYPWQAYGIQDNSGSAIIQSFMPMENITLNTILLRIADRVFDETPSEVQIERVEDGMVLASGLLDQKLVSGLWQWVPVLLDKRIRLYSGVEYNLKIPQTPAEIPWQLHYIRTNPSSQGFQGQNKTFLFKLVDVKFSDLQNFIRCNYPTETKDPLDYDGWIALRFKPTISAPLSIIEVKMRKFGEPADFKIALRGDEGNGKGPASFDLESKVVPAAEIPSKPAAPSWISTTGWTTPLSAGNWYWIIFSMVSPSTYGGYTILWTVNPLEYKYRWSGDRGSTWGRGVEVGELIFKAATTAEVFKVEPEDGGRGGEPTRITASQLMAQSFSPTSNIIAKGIFIYLIRSSSDPGEDLIVELTTSSGTDTPSTPLTSGTLSSQSIAGYGIQYIDFEFPLPLTADEKYWIVLRSSEQADLNCPYYVYREPEDSFGGTDYRAKRSTDGGISWHLPQGRESDIIFSIVEPIAITDHKFYGTSELSADITNYHTYPVTEEPLHGWNTYLNLQTSKILKEATEWFEEYTGRGWHCIDANDMRLIEEVEGSKNLFNFAFGTEGPTAFPPPDTMFFYDRENKLNYLLKSSGTCTYPWSSWGHWGHHMGRITSEQIGLYYTMTLPLLAREANVFDWHPASLSDLNQQKWSHAFGEILSRMRYYGGYYGSEKSAVKALFIGDKDIGTTLQFLTPALNVTLHGFYYTNGDFNLTKFGDFGQFDVIVWWAEGPSMWEVTENVQERVKTFVENGGGLVVTKGWPDWINPILGFEFTEEKITSGNIDYVNYNSPILKPYAEVSGYSYFWRDWRIAPYEPDPGTYIVKDTNQAPWISEHAFGFGRGVFCGTPFENWSQIGAGRYGSSHESYLVLLNNAIFYAAKKENMLPVWWFSDYRTQYLPWHTQLRFTVSGKPGCPVLLWISNNNNATSFEIHLNATFYGIDPSGWIAIDVWNWTTVAKGSGTDIKINLTIPAKSWKPIYICNQSIDTFSLYSNIFILERVILERTEWRARAQVTYTLHGPYKQTSWLIINLGQAPAKITLNEISQIPRYTSIATLNTRYVSDGWFYDSANDLLYIKFKPSSTIHIIRINPETAVPIYEKHPYLIPIAAIAIVATIEVAVWTKRRRTIKKKNYGARTLFVGYPSKYVNN